MMERNFTANGWSARSDPSPARRRHSACLATLKTRRQGTDAALLRQLCTPGFRQGRPEDPARRGSSAQKGPDRRIGTPAWTWDQRFQVEKGVNHSRGVDLLTWDPRLPPPGGIEPAFVTQRILLGL
jgi:hypothetical protein